MLKLASSIGIAFALAELKQRVRRVVTQGVLGAIGVAFLLIGICFLLVAAHLWLSQVLNPVASAAIIGGALLLIALIFFLVAGMKGRGAARRPPPPPRVDTAEENLGRLGDALGAAPFASPALLIAGLALILGFVFGRRSRGED
jgi:Putative Actinobacterial Holin-X, holin superfamily III